MQFEGQRFADSRELAAEARRTIARDGLLAPLHRDDAEYTLLWLDRLAAQRSDWLPAVGRALLELGTSGDPDLGSAVVDWFGHALTAPALAATAAELLERAPQLASTTGRAFDPTTAPVPLAAVVPGLAERAGRYAQAELAEIASKPAWDLMNFANRADLLREAGVAIAAGVSRTGGWASGPHALDFLRNLAYFVPWVRAEVPAVLRELAASGDDRAIQAAVEYALLSGDKAELEPLVAEWLGSAPWLETPARFAMRLELASLGDVLQRVRAEAAVERATRPGD